MSIRIGKNSVILAAVIPLMSCSISDADFDKMCEKSFAYEVHDDKLWQEYVAKVAPYLIEGKDHGEFTPTTEGDFRAGRSGARPCQDATLAGQDGSSNLPACPVEEFYVSFSTLSVRLDQDSLLPSLNGEVRRPIVTFSDVSVRKRIPPGVIYSCFSKNEAKYVEMAYKDWEAQQ